MEEREREGGGLPGLAMMIINQQSHQYTFNWFIISPDFMASQSRYFLKNTQFQIQFGMSDVKSPELVLTFNKHIKNKNVGIY